MEIFTEEEEDGGWRAYTDGRGRGLASDDHEVLGGAASIRLAQATGQNATTSTTSTVDVEDSPESANTIDEIISMFTKEKEQQQQQQGDHHDHYF